MEDPVTGALTYKRLLLGASILGRKLMPLAREGKAVGLMLPNANGAAVTFLALMSAGRVPAMINFTAGAANILAACRAAEVDTIVTSRTFVEKGKLGGLVAQLAESLKIVYLEEVRTEVGLADKLRGLLTFKKPLVRRSPDDPAAILFTSGSEGTPKGVVLSHRNMLANAAQAAARIDFGRTDKVFNVLPVFHSFGLTAGLVLPLVSGVRIYLYPSPLHYRTVPELIYGTNATILFGTDTFLNGYARAAHPYDFRSLRYILAGAEPVKESTRRIYLEKFGVRVLEGYGVTETAPVLALNTPMFNRFGTVGRLMPGMEARLEPVPGVAEGGRLWVRGPNVMLGYLKGGQSGCARSAAGRLARHRRHRHHRRRGLHRHQGARKTLRKNRRRDDLARGSRDARGRPLAGRDVGCRQRSGSPQGRKAHPGDAEARRQARPTSRLSRARAARPSLWSRLRLWSSTRCRCSARASSISWA